MNVVLSSSSAPEPFASVPFKMTAHNGLAEVDGVLRIGGDELSVEYELRDPILGFLKSRSEAVIPLADVTDCEFRHGLLGGKISLRANTMSTFQQIPWRKGAECVFKVRRRHRAVAAAFVEEMGWLLGTPSKEL